MANQSSQEDNMDSTLQTLFAKMSSHVSQIRFFDLYTYAYVKGNQQLDHW